MKKQKKQNLLTAIIIILVIALVLLVGSIIYEEILNYRHQAQSALSPEVEEDVEDTITEKEEIVIEEEPKEPENEELEEVVEPEITQKEEYIGEEENNTQEGIAQSTEERAIDLVKKEWGEDDSVSFNIEQKNGSKYYVVVRSETTALQWYEVDTENWEVSEY